MIVNHITLRDLNFDSIPFRQEALKVREQIRIQVKQKADGRRFEAENPEDRELLEGKVNLLFTEFLDSLGY